MGKGSCYQTWGPEFDPWIPQGSRRGQLLQDVRLSVTSSTNQTYAFLKSEVSTQHHES